ncbi:ribosomal protein L18e/L15P [Papiliotrema laurentii]|uniref:Ribosomal protein L18e/L15P n=1 Tax=Papiliotrema laurentii TaxID=5418 RepID=A0AAD9CZL4_PAPLA|nr:ribosomal protein L18e/L15P [Papiliotrema laurentii]
MLFRSFAGAAALLKAAPIARASTSRLGRVARTLPVRPSPLTLQQRYSSHVTIDHLAPPRPKKQRRRIGRGVGSKRGGHTVGRGHNGAKARGTGNPYRGFEGGQTPLYRRLPKRGFKNPFRKAFRPLNIETIQQWIAQGRFDPKETLTINKAVSTKMVNWLSVNSHTGIKLTGRVNRDLPLPPLTIHLSRFTESAAKAIIKAGGTVLSVYHNRLALWQELHPDKFEGARRVKVAGPTRRKDIEFYTNPAKHGYLSDPAVKDAFFRERGWNPDIKRSRFGGIRNTSQVESEEEGAKQPAA